MSSKTKKTAILKNAKNAKNQPKLDTFFTPIINPDGVKNISPEVSGENSVSMKPAAIKPTIVKPIAKIKKYFYLDFSDEFRPTYQARFIDKLPVKSNFRQEVQLKHKGRIIKIMLCGVFPEYDATAPVFKPSIERKYRNTQFLQSHLQKCIRRQNDLLALQTTLHLMKIQNTEKTDNRRFVGLIMLLRRLPIIILEDVTLHESFTTIVWLMIAVSSTDFKIPQKVYQWLLGVVYVLTQISHKDVLRTNETIINNGDNIFNIKEEDEENEENEFVEISDETNESIEDILFGYHSVNNIDKLSLLYAMKIRILYGNGNCDKIMIEDYIKVWKKRFLNPSSQRRYDTTIIRPILMSSLNELEINDWILSAIDFHTNPNFVKIVLKKFPQLTADENEVKKIIWENSSGINKRVQTAIYNPELWNIIKEHVKKVQRYILDLEH